MNRRKFLKKVVSGSAAVAWAAQVSAQGWPRGPYEEEPKGEKENWRSRYGFDARLCKSCVLQKKQWECTRCGKNLNPDKNHVYAIARICLRCTNTGKNCIRCGDVATETKAHLCENCSRKYGKWTCVKCNKSANPDDSV